MSVSASCAARPRPPRPGVTCRSPHSAPMGVGRVVGVEVVPHARAEQIAWPLTDRRVGGDWSKKVTRSSQMARLLGVVEEAHYAPEDAVEHVGARLDADRPGKIVEGADTCPGVNAATPGGPRHVESFPDIAAVNGFKPRMSSPMVRCHVRRAPRAGALRPRPERGARAAIVSSSRGRPAGTNSV